MTSSNAPRPSSMVGPDIACCYHGDEIMRRRLFDARVLYVMRVANVLRSIEAKPVLHDLIICKRDRSARPQGLADERASSLWPVWGVRPLTRGGGPPGAPPGPPPPSRVGRGRADLLCTRPGGSCMGSGPLDKDRGRQRAARITPSGLANHYTWAVMIMVIRTVRL